MKNISNSTSVSDSKPVLKSQTDGQEPAKDEPELDPVAQIAADYEELTQRAKDVIFPRLKEYTTTLKISKDQKRQILLELNNGHVPQSTDEYHIELLLLLYNKFWDMRIEKIKELGEIADVEYHNPSNPNNPRDDR